MKISRVFVCMCLLISQIGYGSGSITLGLGAAGATGLAAAIYAGLERIKCVAYECCYPNTEWTRPNMTALSQNLKIKLYGQHLVKKVVHRALRGHLSTSEPKKALVMSFHGWTGGGKNYVARFVAESLYKLGMRSNYVHQFVSPLHFPHHHLTDIYKLHLQDWIRNNVTKCERSLFIFDEIDKMPVGMIDAIKPFIDYHESIDGVDFRKSIFLFLSNTGGANITRRMLELWKEGKNREDIELSDLEDLILKGAFNEKGGLHHSELIHHSLVDHYIPFLPLERHHIELCAEDELARRNLRPQKDVIKKVADEMVYFPAETKLFSKTGCKRVAQKVSFLIAHDEDYDRLFD
ncbi:torsin-1A-like isoform X2 [Oratosquilla oratoria]|uniref:torsin-1A-like isoform X2 n=1 Tax=Oratosquilla oratoria TaxID=337810 RepID=UPI003F757E08